MTFAQVEPEPTRPGWRRRLGEMAALHGWRVRMFGADWEPDFLLTRRPRLLWLFAEPDRGCLSGPRYAALVELRACGQSAFVVHPSDIEEVEWLLQDTRR